MTAIQVDDMKCIHCQQKIEKALKLSNIAASIDLANHLVKVEEKDVESALAAIRKAGYTPSL